jgi:lipopolysaccharide export system protein LptC
MMAGWGSLKTQTPTWNGENETEVQQTLRKREIAQRGFHYTSENKCAQLLAERGKFDYTRSAKHMRKYRY